VTQLFYSDVNLDEFKLWSEMIGRSAATTRQRYYTLGQYLKYCEKEKRELNSRSVTGFLLEKKESGVSSGTLAVYMDACRSLFTYLGMDGQLRVMLRPKVKPKKKLARSEDEMWRVWEACQSGRDRAMFILLYDCALRNSEAGGVRMRDVDLDEGVLRVKTLKMRAYSEELDAVPVSKWAVKELRGWFEFLENKTEFVIPGNNGGLSSDAVRHHVKKLGLDARLRKLLPKDLRGSRSTHLMEAGVGRTYVGALLRHVEQDSTDFYIDTSIGRLKLMIKDSFEGRFQNAEFAVPIVD